MKWWINGIALAALLFLGACTSTNGTDMSAAAIVSVQPQLVGRLSPGKLEENSGMVASTIVSNRVYALNDSGHPPELFVFSLNDFPLVTHLAIPVEAARNRDWEDIASTDDGRLLLADVGNNQNKRRDLKIYLVKEPGEKPWPESLPVDASLAIYFPDQTAFPPEKRNFDCEAVFVLGKHVYLLTKHRSDRDTKLYRTKLPDSGVHMEKSDVKLVSRRENVGMVTAADLHPDGKRHGVLLRGASGTVF